MKAAPQLATNSLMRLQQLVQTWDTGLITGSFPGLAVAGKTGQGKGEVATIRPFGVKIKGNFW